MTNIKPVKKPLLNPGWLRVLLFFIALFVFFVFISIPVGFLILLISKNAPGGAAAINPKELMLTDYLWLTALLSLVGSLCVVFIFRRFVDRKSISSLGFRMEGFGKDAATGFFLAPAILGSGSLILYFSNHLRWTDITPDGTQLFIELGIMFMIACSEEIVFRGYILNNLMESFNKWTALVISSILFAVFHLDNPGMNFIPLINIFLAGILLGINYIYTKNLWYGFLLHLGWNFIQGPLLGFKVSGINLSSLLQAEWNGDIMLTGGEFGFEGSVMDTGISLAVILILYWAYEKRKMPQTLPA